MPWGLTIALLTVAVLPLAANAQQPDTPPSCVADGNLPVGERLARCTAMIEAGQKTEDLAAAYLNRDLSGPAGFRSRYRGL